jgi:hypothetical protein
MAAAAAAMTFTLVPVFVVSANDNGGYGPYPSTSPDSGTCGNNWADDRFDRQFTVDINGSITVTEQFQDGTFTTPSTTPPTTNQSPGACQSAPGPTGNGGTVDPGVNGTFHGYFVVPLPPGTVQSSTDPHCNAVTMSNANCTTTAFIDTHFFPPCYGSGLCSATTFFFVYDAEAQCLLQNHWQNASPDVGGNKGDIRSGPPCCPESDGNGDFEGQQRGNFSFDGDGCRDGDQDNVDSSDRGDGKSFNSTSIQSITVDSAAHTTTVTGLGLVAGAPVSFVFTALETGPTTPGWVSFTFSDGYTNAGNLISGSVVLH